MGRQTLVGVTAAMSSDSAVLQHPAKANCRARRECSPFLPCSRFPRCTAGPSCRPDCGRAGSARSPRAAAPLCSRSAPARDRPPVPSIAGSAPGAYAVDVALELAVALRAVEQEVQDQRLPLARDDAERGGEPVGVAATAVLILRAVSHFSWLPKGAYLSLGYQNCILVSSKQFPASVLLQRRMQHMTRLNGKTAVITGGATGIGRAAAKRFIEEGAFVFIFGRRQEALDAAVADLGANARAVQGSVSDLDDLDRLYAAVKAERGTLDIVFANAGAGSQLPLGEITAEHIDEIFDTNVKGSIFTVQKALPLMGEGGSIILTGSSAGTTGAPAFTAYSASKAAVRNLAKTWAHDLKGTGIRVNVLTPGPTATELAKEALGVEGQKAFASMNPLQRMA